MAELGHPVIGPQSFWKLTRAEIRVYAEGLDYQEAQKKAGENKSPEHVKSQERRDEQALQKMDAKAKNRGYDT